MAQAAMAKVQTVRSGNGPNIIGDTGATSLKEEIVSRLPSIRDPSQFRAVRKLVREELGGPLSLREELIFAGFVDPATNQVTTNEKPLNHFARIAKGHFVQKGMELEQEALGEHRDRFIICCNKPECDLHWDSDDPAWIAKASMARRHRFLTTKDLHWQWFNAICFGMLFPEDGGVGPKAALEQVLAMKAAALQYAKRVGGWSDQVGLFVNVFGHNSVNSLFIHVVDLKETGPSFEALAFKNCPLDHVIKVLQEESLSGPRASPALSPRPQVRGRGDRRRSFFFAGTDGATSVKAEITGRIPVIREAGAFREARRILRDELGGAPTLCEELSRAGWVDRAGNRLTVGTKPFNIFARIAAGEMKQPGMEEEQALLGDFSQKFIVCSNRPEADEHWDSEDPEWVGKASMSRRHRFLTTKDLDWQWFNVLAWGMVDSTATAAESLAAMRTAAAELEALKAAALAYAAGCRGWSGQVGMFFHVFGHNSVNSLHLHLIDMKTIGPTFWKLDFKNCPLDAVLKVFNEEIAALAPAPAAAAAASAAAAAEAAAQAARMAVFSAENKDVMSAVATPLVSKQSQVHAVDDPAPLDEIIEISIGGELFIAVPRGTLRVAPRESLLFSMFAGHDSGVLLPRDAQGRVFLDFPARAFKRIVDHLRLLRLAPPERLVQPPAISKAEEQEFRTLAEVLGVADFLLAGPRPGRNGASGVLDEATARTPGGCFCVQVAL